MIRLEHICRDYEKPHKRILDHVCMDIQRGEMVAVMGKSGAGKTTLLNLLGCIDAATSGNYYFDDIDVYQLSKSDMHLFRRDHFSYVFQNFELLPQYSVYENVEIPLLARKVKGRKKIIMDALGQVGIEEHYKKNINKLSGGEQQRCAIARAVVAQTEVILADEPTGSLDEATSEEVMELFRKINSSGKTIIIVTHDIDVANSCQRKIMIRDGKVMSED